MVAPLGDDRTAIKMQCKYAKRGRLEPSLVKRHFRSSVQPGPVVRRPVSRMVQDSPGSSGCGLSSRLVVRSRVRTCALRSHFARGCHQSAEIRATIETDHLIGASFKRYIGRSDILVYF